MHTVLILAGIATLSLAAPQCSTGKFEIIAKSDCRGYYLCVHGKPVEMPDCPPGSVFSRIGHVCVPEGSFYDDCTSGNIPDTRPPLPDLESMPDCPPGSVFSRIGHVCVPEGSFYDDCTSGNIPDTRPPLPDLGPLSIEEQCSLSGGLIPHPSDCQAYYNCSHKYESVPAFFEQYLQECQYPDLFDSDTKSCRPFEEVNCGKRQELKDACDYRSNKCPVAHCIPCHVRFSSCEAKPDGMTAHESKKWSPYFVVCYKERTVAEETCPRDQDGRTQLFHPDRNLCVPLEHIPREHGGMMPDCSGRSDGSYLDDFGRCNQYTICRQGQFVETVKCKKGETFDQLFEKCMPAEETCGPCGSRNDC